MDFLLKSGGSIIGSDFHPFLHEDIAVVILCVDIMHRHARLLFAGRNHSLMHMVAIHPFAAISGQQGGMNVEYPVRISIDNLRGDEAHEACQYHKIDIVAAQTLHHLFRIFPPYRTRYILCGYIQCRHALYHTGIRLVGDYEHYAQQAALVESADYVFSICA